MKRQLLLIILALLLPLPSLAFEQQEKRNHVTIDLTGPYGEDVGFSVGYHRILFPGFGVGASIGLIGSATEVEYNDYYDDYENVFDYLDTKAFFFRPSLLIMSPSLRLNDSLRLGLIMNPWAMIATNYYGYEYFDGEDISWRARRFSVGLKALPTLYIHDSMSLSIGYEISNFDANREYYSDFRHYRTRPNHAITVDFSVWF